MRINFFSNGITKTSFNSFLLFPLVWRVQVTHLHSAARAL